MSDEWGERILQAIGQIQNQLPSTEGNNVSIFRKASCDDMYGSQSSQSQRRGTVVFLIEPGVPLTSVPSILHWTVFQDIRHDLHLPSPQSALKHITAGRASGDTSASRLIELAQYFQSLYPRSSQILSFVWLNQAIAKTDEYGIEWNAESCLILLVAALGSLCKLHSLQTHLDAASTKSNTHTDHTNRQLQPDYPTQTPKSVEEGSSVAMAFRYWNMARKRLSWAMEEDSLLSAQCLCLSGYVQHQFNPSITFHGKRSNENAESGISGLQSPSMLRRCLFVVCNQLPISGLSLPIPRRWNPSRAPLRILSNT